MKTWFKENWFNLLLRLVVLLFVGFSAFSLDPDINWVSRLVAIGLVLYWFSKIFPKKQPPNLF